MKMKAAFYSRYGNPDFITLQELNIPEPAAGETLVQVHATTVNRTDYAILEGSWLMRLFSGFKKPARSTPGTDFAGVVIKTEDKNSAYKPGDRIFGFNDMGLSSHAEYLILNKKNISGRIPSGISFEEAAASLEAAHYAINFINKVSIKPGARVLVHGGTGGIGSALIQLMKYKGAYVAATCRTNKTDVVKSLGADKVIDFTKEDFTSTNEKYDFVFDAVGKSTFGKCKRLLVTKGIYISSELGPYAQNPFLALITSFTGGKKVVFPVPFRLRESIQLMEQLLTEGTFKPLIDRSYKLEDVASAFKYVGSGEKIGNVILKINPASSSIG